MCKTKNMKFLKQIIKLNLKYWFLEPWACFCKQVLCEKAPTFSKNYKSLFPGSLIGSSTTESMRFNARQKRLLVDRIVAFFANWHFELQMKWLIRSAMLFPSSCCMVKVDLYVNILLKNMNWKKFIVPCILIRLYVFYGWLS